MPAGANLDDEAPSGAEMGAEQLVEAALMPVVLEMDTRRGRGGRVIVRFGKERVQTLSQ